MGAFLSKSMDENFKRQQRFQIEMQQTIVIVFTYKICYVNLFYNI